MKVSQQCAMLLTWNVNDRVIRTDGVERVVREGRRGDVLTRELRVWNQLTGQFDLRFGEIHADDFKELRQALGDRHACAAASIEDFGPRGKR